MMDGGKSVHTSVNAARKSACATSASLDGAVVAQANPDVRGLAVAEDGELQRIAGAFGGERTADGIVAIHRLAVDGHDEIATYQQLGVADPHFLPAATKSGMGS